MYTEGGLTVDYFPSLISYTRGGFEISYFTVLITHTEKGGPGTSSHYSLFAHRMDSGHLMSQSLFPTLQGGPGTPYFPTLQGGPGTPYFPVLIPTLQVRPGTSYFPMIFPYTTLWTWNILLPSDLSLHYIVDLEHLTSQCSFPILQDGPGTSYFPLLITCIQDGLWTSYIPVLIPNYKVDLEHLTS